MPFTETIRVSNGTRFVFPEAPEITVPPDGPAGGRAWWRIDLASYINRGEALPDFSGLRPEGIELSNQKIRTLIGDVKTRLGSSEALPILGGFSRDETSMAMTRYAIICWFSTMPRATAMR